MNITIGSPAGKIERCIAYCEVTWSNITDRVTLLQTGPPTLTTIREVGPVGPIAAGLSRSPESRAVISTGDLLSTPAGYDRYLPFTVTCCGWLVS